MPGSISAQDLRSLMESRGTYALIDVRDAGAHNSSHIPGASLLPRARLEFELEEMAPCKSVSVVLCDDDGRQAALAAAALERMGYSDVLVLEGGVNRWTSVDLPTEWGTNVPSKDFGERVLVEHGVPEIDSFELNEMLERKDKLVILDTRTPEEFHNFSLPGGRSVPNGELALRITDILKGLDPDTKVVLNCAGRTRSVIGTRILQRMGIRNAVGLKNGTAGWVLAGYQLERGASPGALPEASEEGRAAAEAYADRAAREDGVRFVDVPELERLMGRSGEETLYLIDVRSREEYAGGHIPGFRWVPGGQAVQRSDDVAAVANGTIVFACDAQARSTLVASWYRQMGFKEVYALAGGVTAWSAQGRGLEAGMRERPPFGLDDAQNKVRMVSPREVESRSGTVVYVETSRGFAEGHVPGARWTPRGWLEMQIGEVAPDNGSPLTVTCGDGRSATLAGATLMGLGYRDVAVLDGGMAAWRREGLPEEKGLAGVQTPPTDVVSLGPQRNPADAIHYLRWEEELGKKYEA